MRKILTALVAAAVLMTGCGPMSDGGTGEVIETKRWKCNRDKSSCRRYSITTARDGSGTRDSGFVSEKVYNACRVGDRWPDCKVS
jgi:surface antigen